jgi:hypothetical protein
MKMVMAQFADAESARDAIRRLHDAGFGEEDIAFVPISAAGSAEETRAERTATSGRRVGEMAADIGQTMAFMLPFVGRNMVNSPLGRALRDAAESTGASTGRVLGALADGGFVPAAEASDDPRGARVSVLVQTEDERAPEVMSILAGAGASAVESRTSQ